MANTREPTGANGPGRRKIDWPKIQDRYVTEDHTLSELARLHRVSESAIRTRSGKERWGDQRTRYRHKTSEDTLKKASEAASDRRARNQRALDLRMDGTALTLLRRVTDAETGSQAKDYAIAFGVVMDKRFQEIRGAPAGPQTGTDVEAASDDVAKFEAIFRATRVQVDRDEIDGDS